MVSYSSIVFAQQISRGHISFRSSLRALSDIGLRDTLTDLFFSFSSVWLKLSLETVFGEFIPIANGKEVELSLRHFIMSRLLSNEEIDKEHVYLESSKGQPFFGDGRDSALERFSLKKILLVFFFLDQAKAAGVISSEPCLFNKVRFIQSKFDEIFFCSIAF